MVSFLRDCLWQAWLRSRARPWLTFLNLVLVGVCCGISASQYSLIRSVRSPVVPDGVDDIYHVRLLVRDARWEKRLPLGTGKLLKESPMVAAAGFYRSATLLVVSGNWATAVAGAYVDPDLLPLFRAKTHKGGIPTAQDTDSGVYLSFALWRRM